jgi:hypothetical protein
LDGADLSLVGSGKIEVYHLVNQKGTRRVDVFVVAVAAAAAAARD